MAVRLIELHRVLKPTGSLYLYCDAWLPNILVVRLPFDHAMPVGPETGVLAQRRTVTSSGSVNKSRKVKLGASSYFLRGSSAGLT